MLEKSSYHQNGAINSARSRARAFADGRSLFFHAGRRKEGFAITLQRCHLSSLPRDNFPVFTTREASYRFSLPPAKKKKRKVHITGMPGRTGEKLKGVKTKKRT